MWRVKCGGADVENQYRFACCSIRQDWLLCLLWQVRIWWMKLEYSYANSYRLYSASTVERCFWWCHVTSWTARSWTLWSWIARSWTVWSWTTVKYTLESRILTMNNGYLMLKCHFLDRQILECLILDCQILDCLIMDHCKVYPWKQNIVHCTL